MTGPKTNPATDFDDSKAALAFKISVVSFEHESTNRCARSRPMRPIVRSFIYKDNMAVIKQLLLFLCARELAVIASAVGAACCG